MADTSDNPTSRGAPAGPAPESSDAGGHPPNPPQRSAAGQPPPALLRSLSPRVTAALAGVMLAIGVAVGAAIGPAPSTSLAGASRLPLLLPSLLAAAGVGGPSSTTAAKPPAVTAQATPSPLGSKAGRAAAAAPTGTPTSTTPSPTPAESAPSSSPTGAGTAPKALPPVTNVWLIELSGSTFANALAQPAAAPYIDGQAIPAGTLLSSWSAVAGSAFASDTALLASAPPQIVDSIVQPPCPEGTAGAPCAPGTPGELTAADEFLKASVPTITSTPAYREHGLIVVTFGSIVSGSASGLPAGASNATFPTQPPAGVLLISPFASAGARSSASFNPTSPKRSLEKLLRR
jgi:hypothetical protein